VARLSMGRLLPHDIDSLPSEKEDEKTLKNLKIKRQRIQRRGYKK